MSTSDDTPERGPIASGPRRTYPQDWRAYNAAQVNEKALVAELLRDLCSAIDNPIQKRGRPRLPLSDSVFCAVMKVYCGMSARRTASDLREFAARGLIDKAPHYNSVLNALENPDLTVLLKAMIEESAAPLKAVETDFAADSSGFSTSTYARWFSAKYGREMVTTQWLKAHVIIGTKTNIVTSVEVTDSWANDGRMLPTLLYASAKRFNIDKLSADKAYSTKRNLTAIDNLGAVPFIPFKSNATGTGAKEQPGSSLWQRMFHYYVYRRDDFLRHYHRRSNVETTFAMIKAKFGSRIRSKTHTAQVNEVLAKILAHNLCCLVQSIYELDAEPEFWKAS